MAKSLNRVDLLGYLDGDADIKQLPDGTTVGKVSVATDHSFEDLSGDWSERTEWHAVVIRGAASASEVLVKGARVHLTGRLRTRSWEAGGGKKRHRTEVVCNALDVIVTALPRDGAKPAAEAPSKTDGHDVPHPEGPDRKARIEW